jgi:ribosomal protein S11
MFEKISFFAKANFNGVKIIIKGHTNKSFFYLKEIKRKKLKLISYKHTIPIVHNGCRPPKKRRI